MSQLRELQTQWNGFKDKNASLFAGVHVQSSVRKLLFNRDICIRTSWSISTKYSKNQSRKREIEISKKEWSRLFLMRNIFELLEISWQIKMKNLFLNNNFARNT